MINMYGKNTMETAVEENNVFQMLNDSPPQLHKLGTIFITGDAHKRNENHLSNILGGSHRATHRPTKNTKMVITQVPGHPPNGASLAASVKLRGGPGCFKKKKKRESCPFVFTKPHHRGVFEVRLRGIRGAFEVRLSCV